MGILNVTPDSFSDGGRFVERERALAHARQMVSEGADLIDVGGESTRPGAPEVAEQTELDRVVPIIEALRAESDVPISIDTSKPGVMREALSAGANMINDVTALGAAGAIEVVRDARVPVCLMHMQGTPRTMQAAPEYADVVDEVGRFLAERAQDCIAAGVDPADVLLDPGFGFGKTPQHNWRLINELQSIVRLGYPVLVGASRKSSIARALDGVTDDRLIGSVTVAAIAARGGARVLRVHDVAPTCEALAIVDALRAGA